MSHNLKKTIIISIHILIFFLIAYISYFQITTFFHNTSEGKYIMKQIKFFNGFRDPVTNVMEGIIDFHHDVFFF